VVCAGYSRSEVEDMLLDFAYLGIENVLALRGDAMRGESQFVPHPHGDSRAIDVLRQIMLLNKGVFIDPNIRNAAPIVEFCAGIAGYPEGHPQSDGEHADMQCLKEKADAGAAYIVTQMFFDNAAYFRFVERCLSMNINLPIIPGLKPLATLKHLEVLPSVFHIVMPEELRKQAMRYGASPQDVRKVGEEWCMRQCQELIANRVPALHFYTMSKAENVERVVSEVFNIKKTE
jgi:methylenetetrahydrofolate reductase (NADPH)